MTMTSGRGNSTILVFPHQDITAAEARQFHEILNDKKNHVLILPLGNVDTIEVPWGPDGEETPG
jgi:hypothetical protein